MPIVGRMSDPAANRMSLSGKKTAGQTLIRQPFRAATFPRGMAFRARRRGRIRCGGVLVFSCNFPGGVVK